MNRFHQIRLQIILPITLSIIALLVAINIARPLVYTTLYFQKSVHYGYGYTRTKPLSEFQNRAEDMIQLESRALMADASSIDPTSPAILGTTDTNTFTIAVIGDSYVWGLGVKNNDIIAKQLTQKLNLPKNSKILTYGQPAGSLIDNANIYLSIRKHVPADLYIFILVDNDSLLANSRRLPMEPETETIMQYCGQQGSPEIQRWDDTAEKYTEQVRLAWNSPVNVCIAKMSLALLPNEHAIYFLTNERSFSGSPDFWASYRTLLQGTNKLIIEATQAKNAFPYSLLFLYPKLFTVNAIESHPSALTYSMYADILAHTIQTHKFTQ